MVAKRKEERYFENVSKVCASSARTCFARNVAVVLIDCIGREFCREDRGGLDARVLSSEVNAIRLARNAINFARRIRSVHRCVWESRVATFARTRSTTSRNGSIARRSIVGKLRPIQRTLILYSAAISVPPLENLEHVRRTGRYEKRASFPRRSVTWKTSVFDS